MVRLFLLLSHSHGTFFLLLFVARCSLCSTHTQIHIHTHIRTRILSRSLLSLY
jgi:hypothetical protein